MASPRPNSNTQGNPPPATQRAVKECNQRSPLKPRAQACWGRAWRWPASLKRKRSENASAGAAPPRPLVRCQNSCARSARPQQWMTGKQCDNAFCRCSDEKRSTFTDHGCARRDHTCACKAGTKHVTWEQAHSFPAPAPDGLDLSRTGTARTGVCHGEPHSRSGHGT